MTFAAFAAPKGAALSHGLSLLQMLKLGSILCIGFALFLGTWQMVSDETGLPYRYWSRYTASLERKLREMFIFTPGRLIALGQMAASS